MSDYLTPLYQFESDVLRVKSAGPTIIPCGVFQYAVFNPVHVDVEELRSWRQRGYNLLTVQVFHLSELPDVYEGRMLKTYLQSITSQDWIPGGDPVIVFYWLGALNKFVCGYTWPSTVRLTEMAAASLCQSFRPDLLSWCLHSFRTNVSFEYSLNLCKDVHLLMERIGFVYDR